MLEELLSPARRIFRRSRLARDLAARYLPARSPWVENRDAKQRRAVAAELGREETIRRFAERRDLRAGYGTDTNERIVEIPWILAQRPSGRVLDAGSALNDAEYLAALQPGLDELHIVTLAPEEHAFPDRGISYVFGDLRELPYRDGYFDTVISISTLEHVGMDNTRYGAQNASRADNPDRELEIAVGELARVLVEGGSFLLTVPYGMPEDHGSFRQFDRAGLDQLVEAARPNEVEMAAYRYADSGWQLSDLDRAAGARYRTGFAAEAVACVNMRC